MKPKVAFYWCSSCGGCKEAIIDLNEDILKVVEAVDIVFWPVAIDTKYADIERLADGELAVTFINGAVRLDEQEEIAKLLRRKAPVVIAVGSCAHMGGIPGLANFFDQRIDPPTSLPRGAQPGRRQAGHARRDDPHRPGHPDAAPLLGAGEEFGDVVDVDYFLPGCPPMPDTIRDALAALLAGKLPGKGSVLSPSKNLCHGCPRLPQQAGSAGHRPDSPHPRGGGGPENASWPRA